MGKYKLVYLPSHPLADKKGCVLKSWLIWNQHHPEDQKKRNDGYEIHHCDLDKKHDVIENLEKKTKAEHRILTHKGHKYHIGKKRTEEQKKKMSLAQIGNQNGKGNKGKKRTEEQIKNQSLRLIGNNCGAGNKGRIPWNKGLRIEKNVR